MKWKFTLKLHPELAAKLNYIAEYYGRTRSAEIIWTLRRHVVEFERNSEKSPKRNTRAFDAR